MPSADERPCTLCGKPHVPFGPPMETLARKPVCGLCTAKSLELVARLAGELVSMFGGEPDDTTH